MHRCHLPPNRADTERFVQWYLSYKVSGGGMGSLQRFASGKGRVLWARAGEDVLAFVIVPSDEATASLMKWREPAFWPSMLKDVLERTNEQVC